MCEKLDLSPVPLKTTAKTNWPEIKEPKQVELDSCGSNLADVEKAWQDEGVSIKEKAGNGKRAVTWTS